jgi:hypothetical protein
VPRVPLRRISTDPIRNIPSIESPELKSRPFKDWLREVRQLQLLLRQKRECLEDHLTDAAELLNGELAAISHRLTEHITRTENDQRGGTLFNGIINRYSLPASPSDGFKTRMCRTPCIVTIGGGEYPSTVEETVS